MGGTAARLLKIPDRGADGGAEASVPAPAGSNVLGCRA